MVELIAQKEDKQKEIEQKLIQFFTTYYEQHAIKKEDEMKSNNEAI